MYHDPKAYEFNDADRVEYSKSKRQWQMPVRLADDGVLRSLWRRFETSRGGGAATSLLPLLAIHAYPARRQDDAALDGLDVLPAEGWTTWTYLSRRRMGPVSGLSRDTVGTALQHLRDAGLLQLLRSPRRGLPKTYYRLNHTLFPALEDRYAVISGYLLYSGTWSMLPISSARHLYLAIAALAPKGPTTIAEMQRVSGLGHRTTHEAIGILRTNTGANSELIVEKKQCFQLKEIKAHWNPTQLNDPASRRRCRETHWPQIAARIEHEKGKAQLRKLKRERAGKAKARKLASVP